MADQETQVKDKDRGCELLLRLRTIESPFSAPRYAVALRYHCLIRVDE